MPRRRRVALLIESSRAYGRGLLAGIAAFARDHGHWSVYHQERGMSDDAPRWFARWQGDGVIARIESPRLLKTLRERGLATVDVRGMHDIAEIPLIETNDKIVTHLAVDHLRARGFQHYAYCGLAGANFSGRRLRYFVPYLQAAGFTPLVYEGRVHRRGVVTWSLEGEGMVYEAALARWIRTLPRPVAIMACNDVRAQQVLNACRELEVAVPDDAAVIGVDNDRLICDLCDPPLSSVEPDTPRIGYLAAELLERMMDGGRPAQHKTFVPPVGVVARRSTDALAIADRDVAAAVRFIREHACDGIDVDHVVEHVPLSRSTLERRFAKLIGRTPKQEITRVQLERAQQLLRDTEFPLRRIADLAGFVHLETLCVRFKQLTGETPGQYRARNRP